MESSNHKAATKLVILLGFVSFFADIASHGAKSIAGAYLADLGASAVVVSIIAGFGELTAYGLRLVSGYITDKTMRYWSITILGYGSNLLAVPLLAFAGSWPTASLLFIAERAGKAMRTPARDAMLSYASNEIGMGWGFGLHQALDQLGGMLGPVLLSIGIFSFHSNYKQGFLLMFIPALVALIILLVAKKNYPYPQKLEITKPVWKREGITKKFWLCLAASSLIAAGYADFPLIAFHFEKTLLLKSALIPLYYAFAMGTSAATALLLGRLYNRYQGYPILLVTITLSSLFAPLVFLGNFKTALLGMVAWGIGMGTQASVLKALIGDMVSKNKRGSAYGLFNAAYGIAWFLGSVIIGILYDIDVYWMVLFSVCLQLTAVLIFMSIKPSHKSALLS